MSKEDAISRQAMFDILLKYNLHESRIAEELEELSPVTPQPKTGRWVYRIYGGFHEQGDWYCSHCNYQFNYGGGRAEYCPKCGYAMYKPISPLTGEDDEWTDVGHCFQNKRCFTVFKDKDGTAYNIEGRIFTDDGGETWYTCKDSSVNITFPYVVPDKPERVYRNKEGNIRAKRREDKNDWNG